MDLKKKINGKFNSLRNKKNGAILLSLHLKIRRICKYFKNVLPKPNEAMIANKAKHLISIFTTPLTPPMILSFGFLFNCNTH